MRCVRQYLTTLFCLYSLWHLAGCTAPQSQLSAEGRLLGEYIDTTVDSETARYYLEYYLAGNRTKPKLGARIRAAERQIAEAGLTRENLREISRRFSTDFATLLFARGLMQQQANRRLHAAFRNELARLLDDSHLPRADDDSCAFLFAPGWFYESTDSGADFARQRELLARMGYHTHLMRVDENGSVEKNAAFIAEEITRFSRRDRCIILVSVSKGGPEVAFALGHLLSPGQSRRVRAWINVGGLLRGTPLADSGFRWPRSWFVRLYFLYKGWDLAGVEGLTRERSDRRLQRIDLPGHVLLINYVGAPFSGQVTQYARENYLAMRDDGPNDGLTLLVDELALGGVTLVELGLDHYYLDPRLDLKTAALARVVIDWLEEREE